MVDNLEATAPDRYAFVREALEGSSIVHVYGEIDLASAPELEAEIGRAAQNDGTVIVDLEPCNYIDSSVLSVLVRAHKALHDRFRIRIPAAGPVRRCFEITSLLVALPIAGSQ